MLLSLLLVLKQSLWALHGAENILWSCKARDKHYSFSRVFFHQQCIQVFFFHISAIFSTLNTPVLKGMGNWREILSLNWVSSSLPLVLLMFCTPQSYTPSSVCLSTRVTLRIVRDSLSQHRLLKIPKAINLSPKKSVRAEREKKFCHLEFKLKAFNWVSIRMKVRQLMSLQKKQNINKLIHYSHGSVPQTCNEKLGWIKFPSRPVWLTLPFLAGTNINHDLMQVYRQTHTHTHTKTTKSWHGYIISFLWLRS